METTSSKNSLLKEHLSVLCECYSTGTFEPLFEIISDDIVMESQWVMTPNVGRKNVEDYFLGKGEALRNNNCCPECEIVQLIGTLNVVDNVNVHLNGQAGKTGSIGLAYPDGKYCMYMSQNINDRTNGVIVDLTLDANDKICRIDLCMPELFNFKPIYKKF